MNNKWLSNAWHLLLLVFLLVSVNQSWADNRACDALLPKGFLTGKQKQFTIIVPRGKGGGSHQLSTKTKQVLVNIFPAGVNISIQNITGKQGIKAITDYLKLPPNGYVLLQHVDDIANYMIDQNYTTFAESGLLPLAIVQRTYSQLYIKNFIERRFTNWPELKDYAQNNELKVAIVGHADSMEGIYINELRRIYGMKIKQIPFNKPAERYMALIQEKTDLLIEQPGDVDVFIKRQLIRPLISLPPQTDLQIPDEPDISKFEQAGMPSMERFRGFFVHQATASNRLAYLECALKETYFSKEFQAFNIEKKMGSDKLLLNTSAADFIKETMSQYKQIKLNMGDQPPHVPHE